MQLLPSKRLLPFLHGTSNVLKDEVRWHVKLYIHIARAG
jgi:hypothetical protein